MKAIIPNIRRFTRGIHAISRIFKISLAAENNIRIVKDTFVFPAVFLIKISYHFHLYLSCPTKSRRSPACCSDFVRQKIVLQKPGDLRETAVTLSDKPLSYKRDLPENCFRKIVPQNYLILKSIFTFTKSVRQKSHCRVNPSAILSDKACPTKVMLQQFLVFIFVRQHQKRAGSFSSSPFPVDHYSVVRLYPGTSSISDRI